MAWSRWIQRLFGGGGPPTEEAPAVVEPEPESAFHPEMFAALRAQPDDPGCYQVLADWLLEQDDPRGHFILAMREGKIPVEMLVAHTHRFYGPLRDEGHVDVGPAHPLKRLAGDTWHSKEPETRGVVIGWRYGFVERLWIRPRVGDNGQPGPPPETISAFLNHRSCWVLRDLTFAGSHLQDVKLDGTYPTVRTLRIGDFIYPDECEASWSMLGDWSLVRERFPNATQVTVQGNVDALDLPDNVESFTLESAVVLGNVVRQILARGKPMQHLELWTSSDAYGGNVELEDLEALAHLTVSHLGVRNCEFTDAFVDWLVKQPVAKGLRTLDLSLGTLTDEGARTLLEHRSAFPELVRLDINDNAVQDATSELEAAFGNRLHVGDQDTEPYVSVTE
ncbi:MAG: hypothetical protein AAGA48_02975 [Myxococcota bacterium]